MDNEILPGYTRVTEISGAFAGLGGVPKEVLNKARERGSCVHNVIAKILNDIPVTPLDMFFEYSASNGDFSNIPIHGYIDSFRSFWKQFENEYYFSPERMYHPELMVTGEVDLIVKTPSERILIDWKCTHKSSPSWDIQGNGYALLYEETFDQGIDKVLFVRLQEDGEEPEVISIPADIECFFKAKEMYDKYFKKCKNYLEKE